jgi:hypothetical protein
MQAKLMQIWKQPQPYKFLPQTPPVVTSFFSKLRFAFKLLFFCGVAAAIDWYAGVEMSKFNPLYYFSGLVPSDFISIIHKYDMPDIVVGIIMQIGLWQYKK